MVVPPVNEMKNGHYKTLQFHCFLFGACSPSVSLSLLWHSRMFLSICSLLSKGLHQFVFLCIIWEKKGSVKKGENKQLDWLTLPSVQPYKAIWSAVANMSPQSMNYDSDESNPGSLPWWHAPYECK